VYVATTGSLLWRHDYRRKADGACKTLSLGAYGEPCPDFNRARAAHQAARTVVKNGGDPAATKKIAAVRSGTFGEFADAWLETRTAGKPNSQTFDKRNVRYLKEGTAVGSKPTC
jgi:hypothetical protein